MVRNPLHTACEHGDNDSVMKLIDAFPEAAQSSDLEGYYPLHYLILKHTSEKVDNVVIKLIEIYPMAVKESTRYCGTALHMACYRSLSVTIIAKLIEIYPFAKQVKDPRGNYPFHYAIHDSIAIIKLLLDSHPLGLQLRYQVVEQVHCTKVEYNETAFHYACSKNDYIRVVQYLMQRSNFQINVRGRSRMTPLHYACIKQCDDILDMLLLHPDVDINATDDDNDTPLHKALSYGYDSAIRISMIQKLLKHPFIIIDLKNNDNKTPLDLMKDCVNRLLLEIFYNIDYNINNSSELTIIHLLEELTMKKRWQAYCYHQL